MPSLSGTYRPRTFAEVTGQDTIKETLRREIEQGKIGHAYLFAGPRGVGKTTTARIFAKALNCELPVAGEPCNACSSCLEADNGNSLDIIEMDAATHTGVDNVREAIIDHVRYAPQRKHKIYILDEAHMFSPSSMNALLKTVEEPPPYAVFMFLTTELHKVPATIQSRCQRFDFKRIGDEVMATRIEDLAKREGVHVVPEVVRTIVGKADGCLRDAETLLGQLLVLGEKELTAEVAGLVLPISQLPVAANLLDSWSGRELGPALASVEAVEAQGIPLVPLFDDLVSAVRQLLLAADSVEWRGKLSRGDDGERALAKLVGTYEPAELTDMALMLMERRRDAKQGADPRFCLELAASVVALGMLSHGPLSTPSAPPVATGGDFLQSSKPESIIEPKTVPTPPNLSLREVNAANGGLGTGHSAPGTASLGHIQGKWPAFLRLMDEKSKSLTFVLKITHPIAVNGDEVTLEFAYPFHRDKVLKDVKTRRMVEETFAQAVGLPLVRLTGIVGNTSQENQESRERDVVSSILRVIGGQVVENEKGGA